MLNLWPKKKHWNKTRANRGSTTHPHIETGDRKRTESKCVKGKASLGQSPSKGKCNTLLDLEMGCLGTKLERFIWLEFNDLVE